VGIEAFRSSVAILRLRAKDPNMMPIVATLAKTAAEAICIRCNETCRSIRSSHCDMVFRKGVHEINKHAKKARVGESYLALAFDFWGSTQKAVRTNHLGLHRVMTLIAN
jgi:hypothetical protein